MSLLSPTGHLGFHNASSLLPTSRGFDSYFGYLAGEQDHFTQQLGESLRLYAAARGDRTS